MHWFERWWERMCQPTWATWLVAVVAIVVLSGSASATMAQLFRPPRPAPSQAGNDL